ncbi:MAG: hypothetical protein KJZ59_06745, partial [Pararhodobacter sp.]|nr:hypothetical protein [Pararhodobacter sp.]
MLQYLYQAASAFSRAMPFHRRDRRRQRQAARIEPAGPTGAGRGRNPDVFFDGIKFADTTQAL